ncbi:hypothetical protein FM103_09855 [Corynebacterium xerosis]|nr:hypothetical protein FM103_09855 [Corynebacterium xerosis]
MESSVCCTEFATIESTACSFEPRVPSPKLVKEYPIVRMIGAIRKTTRKKVPGKRYLPGTKRFVEYRTKIAIAARTMTVSHIHCFSSIMSGTVKAATASTAPRNSTRTRIAGIVVVRSRCAGAWVEDMATLPFGDQIGGEGSGMALRRGPTSLG